MNTLVTAATGKTGRRVLELLRQWGYEPRAAHRAAGFDWDKPATWPAFLTGARAVYLAYAPDIAVPGADDVVASFATAARDHGAERLVLLSGRGEEAAAVAEEAARAVMPATTVVRCAFFAQNFNEGALADAITHGELSLPRIDVPEPLVDADDVAEVAAHALISGGYEGQTYELTGPSLLTFAEAVALIGERTGRQVRTTAVPVDAWRTELAAQGLPGELIDLLAYLFTDLLDGRNSHLTDGVQRALGRPPRSFASFVDRAYA
ncbi:NmrA family transcriptional regulator [Actinoplanes sp. NBC_00393]|uniref:NmrA family transcriptional regulator n=1 Tax=Actinoplanes sp. NBC_00393 TaxID=2975953 RepID=UPI002E1F178E